MIRSDISRYSILRVFFSLLIFLCMLGVLQAHSFPFRTIKLGEPVPDVTLSPAQKEAAVTFSELKGKPFVVVFWGADLPEKKKYSGQILGGLEDLATFLDERGVQRYSVNVQNDDAANVNEVISTSNSTIGLYRDDNQSAYEALGLYVIPSVLLVDGKGNVAAGLGYSHDIVDRLKGSIEIMLGEKTEEQVAAELRPEMKEVSAEAKAIKRHYSYGIVMVKRGQVESAIREFTKVLELDPNMTDAHLRLGALYLEKEDLENAEKEINLVLKAKPDSIAGKIHKGELLRRQGQLDEADALLTEIASANPDNFQALYSRGRIAEDRKSDKQAMEQYKKAYHAILEYSAQAKKD